MDDITIGVTEFVNNISVSAQPNDQIIDIAVTETVETVLLDVSTTVEEVTVTATQNVIVENITVDYVNNENNIDINVTDATQDVTLNVTPTLVEINILRSGGEVNILQFNTLADFPATGSSDYFYLAKDTNKLYRWTGSAYAEISATANARWGQIIGTLSEQTDLQNALNLKAPINSPTFTGTVSGITKGMVGLGAVDNTSDLDKPISTATQTALNAKQPLDADLTSIAALSGTFGLLKKTANNSYTIDTNTYLTGINSSDVTTALGYTPENVANKGVNNGYASLGGDGKVPSSQLPSYVDDVIEVSSFGTLPTTGETGKIYITLDTNKIYRWSGSVYVEVSSSAAVWGGITGTLSNQTDLQTALNAKQDDLNGTGFVIADGTTISYDNTTYYPASNPNGYTSNTGTVTSVALSVPSAFSVSGSPITSSGTLAITGAGTTAQYVRGDGTLATMPNISGFVPYTGATGNVDLGTHTIIAAKGTFSSSGSADTVGITHSSGSGIALNISKGGSGEGIYVNKTSGSGNAVTIIGTLNATTLVKSGGTSSQFLKADGSVDSSTYLTSASLSGYVATTGDQTIAGLKTFSGFALFDHNIFIKQGTDTSFLSGYNVIDATASSIFLGLPNTYGANLVLTSLTDQRNFTFPNASGTIALTSDIPSLAGYVATTGNQSISGVKTFTTAVHSNILKFSESAGFNQTPGYTQIGGTADYFIFANGGNTKIAQFNYGTGTAFNLPSASGTLALTSDLHNAVTIGTANGLSLSTQVLSLALASTSTTGALSSTDWNTFNNKASTASLANYLPLTGGTLTGALSGTSATFVASGTYTNFLIGSTSTTGAIIVDANRTNLVLGAATSNKIVFNNASTTQNGYIYSDSAELSLGYPASGTFNVQKVGVGNVFTIASSGAATFSSSVTAASYNVSDSNQTITKANTSDLQFNAAAAGSNMLFRVAGDERVRITSAGNVGIGTTSPSYKLDVQNGSDFDIRLRDTSLGGTVGILFETANDFSGTSQSYIKGIGAGNSGASSLIFGTATGGGDTTGTERMRITSGGNVGIGTTAPQTLLSIETSGIQNTISPIITSQSSGTTYTGLYSIRDGAGDQRGLTFQVYTANVGLNEKMRITSGGNVGIGTTSPNSILEIAATTPVFRIQASDSANFHGIEFRQGAGFDAFIKQLPSTGEFRISNGRSVGWGGHMTFYTDTAERMRITSGGDLALGDTSAFGYKVRFKNAASSPYGISMVYTASPNVTGDNQFLIFADGTNDKFVVWSSGTAQNRTGVYGTISDISLKENIINASPKLEDLSKLKVRNFNFIGEDLKQIGFVAQEIEEIFPNMVDIDTKGIKSVKTTVLIPMLVKAVQELKAELDTLKNK
jgi:hypothetical protein